MKTYRIHYRQTEYRSCYVEAKNEQEARREFHDGKTMDDSFREAHNQNVVIVEEVKS